MSPVGARHGASATGSVRVAAQLVLLLAGVSLAEDCSGGVCAQRTPDLSLLQTRPGKVGKRSGQHVSRGNQVRMWPGTGGDGVVSVSLVGIADEDDRAEERQAGLPAEKKSDVNEKDDGEAKPDGQNSSLVDKSGGKKLQGENEKKQDGQHLALEKEKHEATELHNGERSKEGQNSSVVDKSDETKVHAKGGEADEQQNGTLVEKKDGMRGSEERDEKKQGHGGSAVEKADEKNETKVAKKDVGSNETH